MAAGSNAIFNEVLQISIDTELFAEQLKQVEAIYAESLSRMPDLSDMGQVASANAFTQAATQIAAAAESIEREVMQMRIKVAESLLKESDATEVATTSNAKWGESVEAGSAAERARFKVIEQAEAEMRKYIATVDQAAVANEKLNASRFAPGTSNTAGGLIGPQTRDEAEAEQRRMAAIEDQAREQNRRLSEDRGSGNVVLGPQTREEAETERRRMAAIEDQAREQNRRLSEDQGSGRTFIGPQTREQFDTSQMEAQTEGMRKASVVNAAYAENEKRIAAEAEAAQGATGRFFSTVASNITMMVEFGAAMAVIAAAWKVLSFPVEVFKTGIEYLKTTQELASQVKATLLQREIFDIDPNKNLAAAATEAERLAKGIQDVAARLNITVPQIKAAFDRFVLVGGTNTTNNNDEALKVTELITAGLQTQVPKEQAARISASEIAKLVQATLTSAQRLPAAFGVSAEKLNEISIQARTTHDLFERLSALAPGLTVRIAESGDRMQSLVAQTKLLWDRLSGTASAPLFDVLLDAMQKVSGWFDEHKEDINQFMLELGRSMAGVAENVFKIGAANWSEFLVTFKAIASVASTTVYLIEGIVNGIKTVFDLRALYLPVSGDDPEAKKLQEHINDDIPGETNAQRKARQSATIEAENTLLAQHKAARAAAVAADEAEDDQIYNRYMARQAALSASYTPPASGPTPTFDTKGGIDTGADKTLLDEKGFKKSVETINSDAAIFIAHQKELLAEHVESQRTASNEIIAALDREDARYKAAYNEERAKIERAPSATPTESKAKQDALDNLDTQKKAHDTKTETERAAERSKADKAEITAAEELARERLKIVDEEEKAELAIIQRREKDGLLTRQQANAERASIEAGRHQQAKEVISTMPDTTEADQAKKTVAIWQEVERVRTANRAEEQRDIDATIADTASQAKYTESMLKSKEVVLSTNLELAKAVGNKRAEVDITKQLISVHLEEAKAVRDAASARAASTITGTDANLQARAELDAAKKRIAELEQQLHLAGFSNSPIGQAQKAQENGTANDQALERFGVKLDALSLDLDNSDTILGKFVSVLSDAVIPFLEKMGDALSTFYNDLKKGNIGGALSSGSNAIGGAAGVLGKAADSLSQNTGDAMSSIGDALGSASDTIPIIGGMIGGMFSAITGFFSSSIQTMVTDLQNQIQAINLAASTKQIGIQQQIEELKQAEQTAISELGGKKKAQSQLQSILTSLNSQIEQLQYQAQQTVQQFNAMVAAAAVTNTAGSTVSSQWLQTWEQINQQVEAYVQSGGSIATAAQYMNQQLAQQRLQLTDQLNQGNAQAIQDALQLNQLQQQKVQLMQQEAKTEFGLLNSDSLERNTASAVATGQALTTQREQYAQQITDLNNQVSLEQQKVAAESKIFDLAQTTIALQAQGNALALIALNEQLSKYQEMQAIIAATNGLVFSPQNINPNWGLNGTQAPIPGLPTVAGPTIGQVNVYTNGDITTANAETLGAAIAANIRSGRTTFTLQ